MHEEYFTLLMHDIFSIGYHLRISSLDYSGSRFQHEKLQVGNPLEDKSHPGGKRKEKAGISISKDFLSLNLRNDQDKIYAWFFRIESIGNDTKRSIEGLFGCTNTFERVHFAHTLSICDSISH